MEGENLFSDYRRTTEGIGFPPLGIRTYSPNRVIFSALYSFSFLVIIDFYQFIIIESRMRIT